MIKRAHFEGSPLFSMCSLRRSQQTVKKSSVHFAETLTAVLRLACTFLSNVPPPPPSAPPAASSSGLLDPDERTATRAGKRRACLPSPCPVVPIEQEPSSPGGCVCKPVCFNYRGKVDSVFFFSTSWVHCSHWLIVNVMTNRSLCSSLGVH